MPTREEIEAMKKEVEDYLREGLKHHIGTPLDAEKVKAELTKMVERMEAEADFPIELKQYNTVATEFLSASFLGMPEGFDPHKMLRDLPIAFVIMLREAFSHTQGFPLNLIWLEILYRQEDLIGDWSFERLGPTDGALKFQLKKPLDYIALNLTINEEKKN